MRLTPWACAALVATTFSSSVEAKGCSLSVPIMNPLHGTAAGGGFDLAGTPYEASTEHGPAVRFWAWQAYARANSGTQPQHGDKTPWLVRPAHAYRSYGDKMTAGPSVWSLAQSNWAGLDLDGCIRDLDNDRTVVELSFADAERAGTVGHRGFYAVSSVSIEKGSFDFDRVRGGGGKNKNIVPVREIPAPSVAGKAAANKADSGHIDLNLELAELVSHTEGGEGAPGSLIAGWRILYVSGDEPTSSDPEQYSAAADPRDPKKRLAVVPLGTKKVKIAVPKADATTWFVTQVVYADPADVSSQVVSAHASTGVSGDGSAVKASGSRSRRGSSTRKR